mmetsp:Transcript_21146/g.53851  ORF Transcript_21146/g.53851 Transcript_21146/m.53851 type:complete len:330 (-) Transcript_21146:1115-2104(-)
MVSRLSASGENQIMTDHISPTEPIVGIDARARAIEKNVPIDERLGRLALDIEAALLLVEPHLSRGVAQDCVVPRMVAVSTVHTSLGVVGVRCVVRKPRVLRLIRISPRRHSVAPDIREIGVLHGCIPVVPADHHCVAIQTLEHAVLDGGALGALQEHCPDAVQSPITARGDAVGVHVGVASGAERQPVESHVVDGVPLGATDVEQDLRLRHHHVKRSGRSTGAIVKQIQIPGAAVVKKLPGAVQLLKYIFHEEVAPAVATPSSLVASFAEGEVVAAVVVLVDLEHPIGPPRRPPDVEHQLADIGVRGVGQRSALRGHSRWGAESERSPS